ncbi:MAG: ABC transporter ATP-binding protein [Erysipelotrichaceae bacterium]|nr:ABC transporter ATP-binding protein [Erysipelotrichaceae bacterium]MDD3925012.1 ABC transporter ATP-binding protein [Erysipelotrichaceae bacterium]MDD4641903.1 ABC transporter ATP-binding protein [Erysipelotrichaceae bacterium]
MLVINELSVYYGLIQALDKVSIKVYEKEIVALIGANGAGKSTLLKAISGLLDKGQGTINFLNEDITKMTAQKIVKKGITHVMEGRRVFSGLTVYENLLMGAYLVHDREQIDKDLVMIYEHFPILQQRKDQDASTLSGGEQQMLAIGRALMARPKILLLDEPSMGLAPILVQEIFNIIEQINQKGTTILVVEQNANMALSIADRAYVMENGRIYLEGTGVDLRNSKEVQKAYLGGV